MEEQKTEKLRKHLVLTKDELSSYEVVYAAGSYKSPGIYYVKKDEANALFEGNLDRISEAYKLKNPFELGLDKIAEEMAGKGEGIKPKLQRVIGRNILKKIETEIIRDSRSIDHNLSWTGLDSLSKEDRKYLSERGLVEHSLG